MLRRIKNAAKKIFSQGSHSTSQLTDEEKRLIYMLTADFDLTKAAQDINAIAQREMDALNRVKDYEPLRVRREAEDLQEKYQGKWDVHNDVWHQLGALHFLESNGPKATKEKIENIQKSAFEEGIYRAGNPNSYYQKSSDEAWGAFIFKVQGLSKEHDQYIRERNHCRIVRPGERELLPCQAAFDFAEKVDSIFDKLFSSTKDRSFADDGTESVGFTVSGQDLLRLQAIHEEMKDKVTPQEIEAFRQQIHGGTDPYILHSAKLLSQEWKHPDPDQAKKHIQQPQGGGADYMGRVSAPKPPSAGRERP